MLALRSGESKLGYTMEKEVNKMVKDHIEKEARVGSVIRVLKTQISDLQTIQWKVAFLNTINLPTKEVKEEILEKTYSMQMKTHLIGEGLKALEELLKNVEH